MIQPLCFIDLNRVDKPNKRQTYGKKETTLKKSPRAVDGFQKSQTKQISEGETDFERTPCACQEAGGAGCRETYFRGFTRKGTGSSGTTSSGSSVTE
jgi:hypothetical protein